jgi:hypothetical protein
MRKKQEGGVVPEFLAAEEGLKDTKRRAGVHQCLPFLLQATSFLEAGISSAHLFYVVT